MQACQICWGRLTLPRNFSSAIVERIDEFGNGNSGWIIFAGLDSELYYAGGAKVEWVSGFGPPDEHAGSCRYQGRRWRDLGICVPTFNGTVRLTGSASIG